MSDLTAWPSERRLYEFCMSPWIFIRVNNFFKLPAPGIEPLTLGLQGQSSTPRGTQPKKLILEFWIEWKIPQKKRSNYLLYFSGFGMLDSRGPSTPGFKSGRSSNEGSQMVFLWELNKTICKWFSDLYNIYYITCLWHVFTNSEPMCFFREKFLIFF